MKLVFAGTPEFSVPALDALVASGHEIAAVYTQPDRPAGRGQKLTASPVAQRAVALGIPVLKPARLRGNDEALDELRGLRPDCMVVVAYGLILPQAVLDIPPRGCLNIHASLLPRWRGAAPIQRAVLAGDTRTGVTIMRMDAGLDTGPMLLMDSIPLLPSTTAGEVHDALSAMGARLIVQALDGLQCGHLSERAQPEAGVTYASKLSKDEARLDWNLSAEELVRRIHGYNPMPGAWCEWNGERIKLLRAIAEPGPANPAAPGTVVAADADGLHVQAGSGAVRLLELQRPGARPAAAMSAYGNRPPQGHPMR
ncbi:MAG: methionyl-tRNA formyltransferase [Panacagrimonas sp.]|nr:methionyl-tRNA formyltransferase [Panacagrimonas sp.]MCC2659051.1 methionyl-tRNA formyltransferase [Panacagrimonas sp.]